MTSFDTYYTDEAVCPHCGAGQMDSWELGGGYEEAGVTECGTCSEPFGWSVNVRYSYSTNKIKDESNEYRHAR